MGLEKGPVPKAFATGKSTIFANRKMYIGVSKNSGTPKWMVKIMEIPIKMDDLGVPLFSETPIYPHS